MKLIMLGTRVGALAALAAAGIDERDVMEDRLSDQETEKVTKKPNTVSQAKRRKYKRQRGQK